VPGIIRCPNCGQEIDSNSRFCVHCTARICPGCHGPVPPRAVYCPHCGFSVGPAMPGTADQQPAPPPTPPPRPFPSSQGGITGPQPTQQPSYPQAPPYPTPGATPETPMPQPMQQQQYGTAEQAPGAYGSPGATPYTTEQQPPVSTRKTFVDTGPIRVRRFPTALIVILVIILVGVLGVTAFNAGWLEAPLGGIQGLLSGIDLPEWLTFGSKDTTPPIISNLTVSDITQTGAVITWQTDKPSTSQAMTCEPEGGCIWTELDENLVTNHSVSISNLKPNTTYHVTATSTDAEENQAIAEGDFTTLEQVTTITLAISGIEVSKITDLSATISWATDKPATSQVEYGTTNEYGSSTTLDESLTTSHSVTLSGLKPNTTYHFKTKSKDESGNEAASQDQTLTTSSTVPPTTDVGYEIGMLAPDFTLPTLDGEEITLSQLRGKIVMINFWQDVQQSRNELGNIQAIYNEWSQDELAILAISWKQNLTVIQNVVTSKGLTLPVLLDETGEVGEKYNVMRCPNTFFIDAQGVIRDTVHYPSTLKSTTQIESILNSIK